MLKKFEVNGIHLVVDQPMRKYIDKKIGGIDKYIPRKSRGSAHAEVFLKEEKAKKNNSYVCDVTLYLPHQTIIVKEKALSMYTSIDVAEAKLKSQLKKYKELHTPGKTRRHLMGRFARKSV
jgi:ribosomal subunit interface protein